MPSIWLLWARPAVPCAVPAARRSGWRGRRMRSRSWLPRLRWRRPATDPQDRCRRRMGGARPRGGQPGPGHPRRRQPLDFGRLAGRRRRLAAGRRPIGPRSPGRRARPERTQRPAVVPASCSGRRHVRAPGKPFVSLANRLRRHGRAGAGADDLARRRGAAVAADRRLLQDGRARRKSARAAVQGRQDHHRNRGRQTGAGDRGRDHRPRPQAGRIAAAALSAFATRRARKSTPGTRCWSRPC